MEILLYHCSRIGSLDHLLPHSWPSLPYELWQRPAPLSYVPESATIANSDADSPHLVSTQETLPAAGEFGIVTPEYEYEYDDEKVEFPSTERPMPTFNATYGNQFSGRGQPFISNGPRFYNQAPQPGAAVVLPPHALTRAPSDKSTHSYSSEKSASSWESYYNYSHSRNNSGQYGHSKRWVIE